MTAPEETGPHWGETHDGHYLVTCPTHGLMRLVDTEAHARNLYALHLRRDHDDDTNPVAVNLTAAARVVLDPPEDGWDSWDAGATAGAEAVWEALISLSGIAGADDALTYARQIADADPPITALVPPF